jgi:hypothetical protein
MDEVSTPDYRDSLVSAAIKLKPSLNTNHNYYLTSFRHTIRSPAKWSSKGHKQLSSSGHNVLLDNIANHSNTHVLHVWYTIKSIDTSVYEPKWLTNNKVRAKPPSLYPLFQNWQGHQRRNVRLN